MNPIPYLHLRCETSDSVCSWVYADASAS